MSKQRGFTTLEIVAVTAAVLLVLAAGVAALHRHKTPAPAAKKTSSPHSSPAAPTTAVNPSGWHPITAALFDIKPWKVHVTLPADSVGSALYKFDSSSPFYLFSIKNIVDNTTCAAFFSQDALTPGVQMARYSGTFSASNVLPYVGDDTITLDQFYGQNKAAGGNYFLEDNNNGDPTVIPARWYKVGSNFYTLVMPSLTDTYTKGFAQYCGTSPADYYQQFAQMLTTIQAD